MDFYPPFDKLHKGRKYFVAGILGTFLFYDMDKTGDDPVAVLEREGWTDANDRWIVLQPEEVDRMVSQA